MLALDTSSTGGSSLIRLLQLEMFAELQQVVWDVYFAAGLAHFDAKRSKRSLK